MIYLLNDLVVFISCLATFYIMTKTKSKAVIKRSQSVKIKRKLIKTTKLNPRSNPKLNPKLLNPKSNMTKMMQKLGALLIQEVITLRSTLPSRFASELQDRKVIQC